MRAEGVEIWAPARDASGGGLRVRLASCVSVARRATPMPASSRLAGAVLAMAMLATGCSESAPAATPLVTALPDAAWTACGADNQCEAVWLSCRGWQAVNRGHVDRARGWYDQTNQAYLSRVECDGKPLQAPTPSCRAQRCSLE